MRVWAFPRFLSLPSLNFGVILPLFIFPTATSVRSSQLLVDLLRGFLLVLGIVNYPFGL